MKRQSSTSLLLATDRLASPLLEVGAAAAGRAFYTPYGYRPGGLQGMQSHTAFTGQVRESETGWYMLGNGHRAYNPILMRFHSPDQLSPFGAGGLNSYAYCAGDPINSTDPSGRALSFVYGIAALGIGTAAAALYGKRLKNNLRRLGPSATVSDTESQYFALTVVAGVNGAVAGLSTTFGGPPGLTEATTAIGVVAGGGAVALDWRMERMLDGNPGVLQAPAGNRDGFVAINIEGSGSRRNSADNSGSEFRGATGPSIYAGYDNPAFNNSNSNLSGNEASGSSDAESLGDVSERFVPGTSNHIRRRRSKNYFLNNQQQSIRDHVD